MHARPLDAFAATLVFALCVVWGFNQVVVKLALPDVGPIAQTGIRSGIGALCVIAYALAAKRRVFEIDGTEAAGALAGALFTAEFIALYESLRFTTAARATVFIYAAPFFVAVGAAFLLRDERLRPIQWAGLGVRLPWRRLRLPGADERRQPRGRRARAPGRGPLGGDDHRHQGDAAEAHRSDQGAALSDRIRCARCAACGLRFRRSVADASDDDVGRRPAMARRRCGWRQLRALVLDAHPLRRGRALGLHLHHPAGRRARRLAGVRRDFELGVCAGDRAGHRRARAGQLAARARERRS